MNTLPLSRMENPLLSSLQKGVDDALKDNILARRLLKIVRSGDYLIKKRKDLTNNLLSANVDSTQDTEDTKSVNESTSGFRDLRFKYIALQNIKKYPGKKGGPYYGLSFCKKRENGADKEPHPVSSVFLGFNGVGKTSLFAALEYVGMGEMKTALVRGYDRKIGQAPNVSGTLERDQSDFLMHYGSDPLTEARIIVKTVTDDIIVDGFGDITDIRYPLVNESFYCSDYDVRQLEICEDYSEFLLSQLGLKDMSECLQFLYYTGHYIQQKEENFKSKLVSSDLEWKESVMRLEVGIVSGISRYDHQTYEVFSEKDIPRIRLNRNMTTEELGNSLGEWPEVLRKEKECFYLNDWYSEGIVERYDEMLSIISIFENSIETGNKPDNIDQYIITVNNFMNFHESLAIELKEIKKDIDGITDDSRSSIVKKWMEKYREVIIDQNKYLEDREEYLNLMDANGGLEKLYDDYKQLTAYIEEEIKIKINSSLPHVIQSISSLLKEYFVRDNDDFGMSFGFNALKSVSSLSDINYSEETQEGYRPYLTFKITIKSCGGDWNRDPYLDASPRAYLNTFKYKLFCVGMKMMLCCVSKRIYNINYPFIIDDVFDSSDFENRVKIREFVANMKVQHDKFFLINKSDEAEKFSLQFIFFTQDDLIADQFVKGIRQRVLIEDENTRKLLEKNEWCRIGDVRYGHIFDYHEMEQPKSFIKREKDKEHSEVEDLLGRIFITCGEEKKTVEIVNLADEIL